MARYLHNWSNVPLAPGDPILSLNELFNKDQSNQKVNLGVGAYKDENGKPWILPSVLMAEKLRYNEVLKNNVSHEYLPINGNPSFVNNAIQFAYGKDIINNHSIAACQTISGSGAIRLAAEFLKIYLNAPVFIPDPSWPNHFSVFTSLNFETYRYRYWDKKNLGLDLEGLVEDMNNAPNNSIFILHVCAHNPTGCDPNKQQWKEIETIFKRKNHFAFFDMAYQGFATGNPDDDAWPIRYFVEKGHRVLLCQSFAKNMGLYGQRVGTLSLICQNQEEEIKCVSQLKALIRTLYSSPPRYGSEIAASLFNNNELFTQWKKDIVTMSDRVKKMREELYSLLKSKNVFWDHILNQKGMFAFSGLSEEQVERLKNEYHIYITKDGRISIPGLNSSNIKYVANCFADVSRIPGSKI